MLTAPARAPVTDFESALGRQLADQLLIAAGAIGKGASGHELKPPMASPVSCTITAGLSLLDSGGWGS
jgi:hypothetical protein